MNSFQQWAIAYAYAAGFVAKPLGNWVQIDGHAIMSVDGLERFTA